MESKSPQKKLFSAKGFKEGKEDTRNEVGLELTSLHAGVHETEARVSGIWGGLDQPVRCQSPSSRTDKSINFCVEFTDVRVEHIGVSGNEVTTVEVELAVIELVILATDLVE